MSLNTYLVPRGPRGIWYLRVAVPRPLHAPGEPKERIRSMGTTDRKIAEERAYQWLHKWKSEWRAAMSPKAQTLAVSSARTNDPPAPHLLDEAAVILAYDEPLEKADAGRRSLAGRPSLFDAHRRWVEMDLVEQTRASATEDDGLVRDLVDDAMAAFGVEWPRDGEDYRSLVERLNASRLAKLHTERRRLFGDLDADFETGIVARVRQRERDVAGPGQALLDLYDAYADWRCQPGRAKPRPRELFSKDRPVIELLAEFLGENRAPRAITKDDARAFRDMLRSFPASRGKIAKLAKATIAQCVQMAHQDGLKLLSLTTQAKYISIISPFFDWLVSDAPRSATVDSNVFDGLHPAIDKGANRRPSYNADTLNRILGSPLFAACGGDGAEHQTGDVTVRDHRYWIPLLCLFTGSRISEIAQLRIDDVGERDGVPLIHLRHDSALGQRTKGKKTRIAALHEHVLAAGFNYYCETQVARAKVDGDRRLFPDMRTREGDPIGNETGRWFRRYLERIGVKDGADGIGAHSFRHTLTVAMRNAGFMDLEFGQLVLGHANHSITALYGDLPQGTPGRLKVMVDAAFRAEPFKDVHFGHLAPI